MVNKNLQNKFVKYLSTKHRKKNKSKNSSKNSSKNLSKKNCQKNLSKKFVIGIHTIGTKVTQKLKNSKKA